MNLFGDKLEMNWDAPNGVLNGYGYGIGNTFIIVGEFINGSMNGMVHVFNKHTGDRILKAEFKSSVPHGEYTMYYNDIIETGTYKNGIKHFYLRKCNGTVFEYGFCKNNKFHGFASIRTVEGTFTSPYWDDGLINGLGCVEDTNGDIVFYGIFNRGIPLYECNDNHPMLMQKYEKAQEFRYSDVPVQCAINVLT